MVAMFQLQYQMNRSVLSVKKSNTTNRANPTIAGPVFARNILIVTTLLTLISLVIASVLKFYFNYPVENILSFNSFDPPSPLPEGEQILTVGHHYFGDYLWMHFNSLSKTLAESGFNATPWPPITYLFFSPLTFLPYYFGLALFILLIVISCCFPIFDALRSAKFSMIEIIHGVLFLGLLSAPSIVAIDRGNAVGLLPSLLYCYFIALDDDRDNRAIVYLVLMTVIKPHAAVFLIGFAVAKKFAPLVTSVLLIFGVQFVGFIFSGGPFWTGIRSVVRASQSMLNDSPSHIFQGVFNGIVGTAWIFQFRKNFLEEWVFDHSQLIAILVVAIIYFLAFQVKKLPFPVRILLTCLTFSLILPYSPTYNYVTVLVALALITRQTSHDNHQPLNSPWRPSQMSRSWAILLTPIFTALLVPSVIPYKGFVSARLPLSVAGILLLILVCLIRVLGIPNIKLFRAISMCLIGFSLPTLLIIATMTSEYKTIVSTSLKTDKSIQQLGNYPEFCTFNFLESRSFLIKIRGVVALNKPNQGLFQTDNFNKGIRAEIGPHGEVGVLTTATDGSLVGISLGKVMSTKPFQLDIRADSPTSIAARLNGGPWTYLKVHAIPTCSHVAVGMGFSPDRMAMGILTTTFSVFEQNDFHLIASHLFKVLLSLSTLLSLIVLFSVYFLSHEINENTSKQASICDPE